MIDEAHPLDGQIEPAAEEFAKRDPRMPAHESALMSIAISLKRIADLLDGDMNLDHVAHSAGIAFQNGVNRAR